MFTFGRRVHLDANANQDLPMEEHSWVNSVFSSWILFGDKTSLVLVVKDSRTAFGKEWTLVSAPSQRLDRQGIEIEAWLPTEILSDEFPSEPPPHRYQLSPRSDWITGGDE